MDASNITDIAKVTDPQMGRLGTLASDMQKTYADAYSSQLQALLASNQKLGHLFLGLLQCRQPQDVIAAETNILMEVMVAAAGQAQAWVDVTHKTQACCAEMAQATGHAANAWRDAVAARPPIIRAE
jgi:hypothetical protein